jgi:hypothetical protein
MAQDLRTRIFALAEALYQSIGMQLSVDLYKAVHVTRGANLDALDFPLNSRFWLKQQFGGVRELKSENARLKAIDAIVNRTNPGPGGFYDDLGNPSMQPHLVEEGPGFDSDPGAFHSVRLSIRPEGAARLPSTGNSDSLVGLRGSAARNAADSPLRPPGRSRAVQIAGGVCRYAHEAEVQTHRE